jgi:hypothetical protein
MAEGRGPPDEKIMRDFVEEAESVADLSEEARALEPALDNPSHP